MIAHRITLHSACAYHRQPWKNGQGITTEIAKFSNPDRDGDFIWRLSIADIRQDGPFSSFPGIDRTLMLLSGNGIDLSFDRGKSRHRLKDIYSHLSFDGAEAVDCRLIDGDTRDFNVMTRRDAARHQFQVLKTISGQHSLTTQEATLLIFCMGGILSVDLSGQCHAVAELDTLEINGKQDTPVSISSTTPASCALIHIQYA